MQFKRQKRNAKLLLSEEWSFWRLASVKEVTDNLETIKQEQILESWDIARLLDGWVGGPGYRYDLQIGYKDMGDMLLIKTPISRPSDAKFNGEVYSGIELNTEGVKAAVLLSCDDKITEVICFVLKSVIDKFEDPVLRQAELDHLSEYLEQTLKQHRTILHYAADQPHNEEYAQCVAELILETFEYGKELIKAADKYGRTALHFAALHGHIHLCSFLMDKRGLKADEKDGNGENILHFVVNSNEIKGEDRLLQMNEVTRLVASQDAKGKTPLHKAAANGNKEIIGVLLRGMNEADKKDLIQRADLFGQTALLEAVSGGHLEAVEYLLEEGSRPLFERSSEGKTALHYCVQLADKHVAKEIARILLNRCRSGEERLLLLWASATGIGTAEQSVESSPEVQTFLKEQRENESKTGSSSDLLLSAVKHGYDALAWELINRGANTSQLHNYP